MRRWIIGVWGIFLVAVAFTSAGAGTLQDSDPVNARHSSHDYVAGGFLEISVEIDSGVPLTALGYRVILPEQWSFAGVSGSGAPSLVPSSGKTGTVNLAWITPPEGLVAFSFTLAVPDDCRKIVSINGLVLYRIDTGGEEQLAAQPDPLVVYPAGECDLDGNGDTNLADIIGGLQILCGRTVSISDAGCGPVALAGSIIRASKACCIGNVNGVLPAEP